MQVDNKYKYPINLGYFFFFSFFGMFNLYWIKKMNGQSFIVEHIIGCAQNCDGVLSITINPDDVTVIEITFSNAAKWADMVNISNIMQNKVMVSYDYYQLRMKCGINKDGAFVDDIPMVQHY